MNEGEQPTWDYFLMFSSHCLDRNYVICERKDPWLAVSEVEKEDEVPQAAPSEAAPTRKGNAARPSPSVGSMLGHRLRRWPDIEPTLRKLPAFAGNAAVTLASK